LIAKLIHRLHFDSFTTLLKLLKLVTINSSYYDARLVIRERIQCYIPQTFALLALRVVY